MATTTKDQAASKGRIDLMTALLGERQLPPESLKTAREQIAEHQLAVSTDGEQGEYISWQDAKRYNAYLLARPLTAEEEARRAARRQPRPKANGGPRRSDERITADSNRPAREGAYRVTDADAEKIGLAAGIYIVRTFVPEGSKRRMSYTKQLVELSPDADSRLDGAGNQVRYGEEKAPKAHWKLTDDQLLSDTDAETLGIQWSNCLDCATKIETVSSIEERHGVGPTCIKKPRWAGLRERIAAEKKAAA